MFKNIIKLFFACSIIIASTGFAMDRHNELFATAMRTFAEQGSADSVRPIALGLLSNNFKITREQLLNHYCTKDNADPCKKRYALPYGLLRTIWNEIVAMRWLVSLNPESKYPHHITQSDAFRLLQHVDGYLKTWSNDEVNASQLLTPLSPLLTAALDRNQLPIEVIAPEGRRLMARQLMIPEILMFFTNNPDNSITWKYCIIYYSDAKASFCITDQNQSHQMRKPSDDMAYAGQLVNTIGHFFRAVGGTLEIINESNTAIVLDTIRQIPPNFFFKHTHSCNPGITSTRITHSGLYLLWMHDPCNNDAFIIKQIIPIINGTQLRITIEKIDDGSELQQFWILYHRFCKKDDWKIIAIKKG